MEKEIKKLKKEIQALKEDVELNKFSLMVNSGISMSLKDFESGRYGEGDKAYFKREWEKMKERAKKIGLL